MAYSNFTLKDVQKEFQLDIKEDMGIFAHIEPIQISESLSTTLAENVPLAVSINTEKARSELIVVNILLEIRKIFQRQVSLFSGIDFTVDKDRGLNGYCDFLVSQSPEQLFINAPVIAIVEAKNDNIMSELGQCVSEMVAAFMFTPWFSLRLKPRRWRVSTAFPRWRVGTRKNLMQGFLTPSRSDCWMNTELVREGDNNGI
jgi:hypothetical protein